MMLNKNVSIAIIIPIIFILVMGCSLSASSFSVTKIFELDLTDQGISSEGGEIELEKHDENCSLILSIYEESGQEVYRFNFKKDHLISTSYLKYRYKNGLITVNDDLKDLIADDSNQINTSTKELIINELFIGNKNKKITKLFDTYKQEVPKDILKNNCDFNIRE